ncbi:MAG: C-GCAxxG-C-C family protein [Dehalococcoidales bacterium]|jgi:C_GCAxxG_C_C family probable redox protein|nr:C-GCAxxG-C-C family protein [Dehalococcoidales bacterium]|tara:strand:- start:437 stop:946 length:510 start_codon:yes stop_codon:yes gene_type:complete
MEQAEKARNKAHQYQRDYGGCAQSVLGALQEELEIGSTDSFKALSVLAGGIARQGETCGAVVGALSALGLANGRERIEDTQANKDAMDQAVIVTTRFKNEMKKQFTFKGKLNSTLCRHVQKKIFGRSFDLLDKDDFRAFVAAGGRSDAGCPKVCGVAAQVSVEEISKLQ